MVDAGPLDNDPLPVEQQTAAAPLQGAQTEGLHHLIRPKPYPARIELRIVQAPGLSPFQDHGKCKLPLGLPGCGGQLSSVVQNGHGHRPRTLRLHPHLDLGRIQG